MQIVQPRNVAMRIGQLFAVCMALLVAACSTMGANSIAAQPLPVSVVYQFDKGLEQATHGLRNVRAELEAEPNSHIVVVAIGPGVHFLIQGAKTAGGYPYDLLVQDLQDQGVKFKVCKNTLQAAGIDESQILPGVELVQSGMAEIARLQSREGFAYIKP